MNNKSYEILFNLVLLQKGELNIEDINYIQKSLQKNQGEQFNEKEFQFSLKQIQAIENYRPDASSLRVERIIDYMDAYELKTLFLFLENFLSINPLPSFHFISVLKYSGNILDHSNALRITKDSYPNLFNLLEQIHFHDTALRRLDIIRSQIADLRRHEKGAIPLPLSEIIVQLVILFCCEKQLNDKDYEVYNIIIRFARKSLADLSFQQVMKVCNNIKDAVGDNHSTHHLFTEQVSMELNIDTRKSLIEKCFEIRDIQKDKNEIFLNFIQAVTTATRICSDDLAKIIFLNSTHHEDLPENFFVWSISDKPEEYSIPQNSFWEKPLPAPFTFKSDGSKITFSCPIINEGTESEFSEGAIQYFDGYGIIFKPSANQVCLYHLKTTNLYVSNVTLEYKGNRILNDVSMMAQSGEMIAVVGPSGCGKSTMLTMLSGILGYTDGDIYFDGRRISSMEDFAEISTYIPQDDILFRELTVHESIKSSLKLKVDCDEKECIDRIDKAIKVLDLKRTEFLKIGNEGEKGISGGQRKRVNIGTTIVAEMKPILLFDEPTSGLDPATDIEIMQLLRQLSRSGHIVLCVTHNLSPESISYFDKLMVLGKTGQVQFYGKQQRSLFFFSIKSTQVLFQKMKDAIQTDFNKKFIQSPEHKSLMAEIAKEKNLVDNKTYSGEKRQKVILKNPSAFSNFNQFFFREITRKIRDPQFLLTCLCQPLLIGIFISWNFIGPLPNALFSLITASLWIGAISGVREINSEIPQLKRDYMYGTSLIGYFISKILSCLTFSASQVFLLGLIVILSDRYLTEPFQFNFTTLSFYLLLLNLFGICLGLFLSAAIRSTLAAVGILPVILIPLIIMGGALILHSKTDGLQWQAIKYNPLRSTYEASLYSSKAVLRPSISKLEARSEEDAQKQIQIWKNYEEKLNLFESDLSAYKEKYTEPDLNDLFSDMLDDEAEASEEESIKPPTKPNNVTEPELLIHHIDLWLQGYSILPIDHLEEGKSIFEAYEVTAPKAFSDSLSAQGAIGMYRDQGKQSLSAYSPIEFILIPLGEILILILGMYILLKNKLSSKF